MQTMVCYNEIWWLYHIFLHTYPYYVTIQSWCLKGIVPPRSHQETVNWWVSWMFKGDTQEKHIGKPWEHGVFHLGFPRFHHDFTHRGTTFLERGISGYRRPRSSPSKCPSFRLRTDFGASWQRTSRSSKTWYLEIYTTSIRSKHYISQISLNVGSAKIN